MFFLINEAYNLKNKIIARYNDTSIEHHERAKYALSITSEAKDLRWLRLKSKV